jgi:putative transposase
MTMGGMAPRTPYPTDLTDNEWALIAPYVPTATPGGRPEKSPTRDILDGIFYLLRGGCAWRLLPHDCPPWQMVSQDFWRWQQDGTWQVLHARLRGDMRVAAGRPRQPRAGLLESPSLKTTEQGGSVAMTRPRRSKDVSATCSSIPSGSSSP